MQHFDAKQISSNLRLATPLTCPHPPPDTLGDLLGYEPGAVEGGMRKRYIQPTGPRTPEHYPV